MATPPGSPSTPPSAPPPTQGTSGTPLPSLPYDLRIEVLRLLQSSTLSRWANRREYEWKLSYAFWAALAGFIATVTLGKDSKFTPPPIEYLAIWLGAMILLHGYYLYCMVDRTLQDIEAQCDIELTLHKLDSWVEKNLPSCNLGAGMGERSWLNKRYGLVAQMGITLLLSTAALWFGIARGKVTDEPRSNPTVVTVTCQPSPAVIHPSPH